MVGSTKPSINITLTWHEALLVCKALKESRFDAEHNYTWNNDHDRDGFIGEIAELQDRIAGVMGLAPAFPSTEEGASVEAHQGDE